MGAIKFIDINTSNVFDGSQPYIFWFDEGQSVNIQYVKQICFVSHKENMVATIVEGDEYIFNLLDVSKINISKSKALDLTDLKSTKIVSQGTEYNDSGLYVHMIYILASSTDIGEHIGEFTIDDETFSIGADFYINDDRLTTTLSNMGVEIPEYVQRAIYESNIHEPAIDNILMNRKWKELLLEYINIIANKGSYNSLINSLKWFEWGDLVRLQEYWRYMNYDKQWLRATELMSITSDEIQTELKNSAKTTYIGLFAALDKLVYEGSDVEYEDHFNANEGWLSSGGINAKGRSAYTNLSLNVDLNADNRILQIGGVEGTNRISHVSDVNVYGEDATGAWFHRYYEKGVHIKDEDNPKMTKNIYMWGLRDLALKMALLGNYFETYFMPIHLDLLNACIENEIYTNTIKVLNGADIHRYDTIDHNEMIMVDVMDGDTYNLQDVTCYVYPDTPFSKQQIQIPHPILNPIQFTAIYDAETGRVPNIPMDPDFEFVYGDEWIMIRNDGEIYECTVKYGPARGYLNIEFGSGNDRVYIYKGKGNNFACIGTNLTADKFPLKFGLAKDFKLYEYNWDDFLSNPNITAFGVDTVAHDYDDPHSTADNQIGLGDLGLRTFHASAFTGVGAVVDINFTIPNKDAHRAIVKSLLFDNDSDFIENDNIYGYTDGDIKIQAQILIQTVGEHKLRFEFFTNSGECLVKYLKINVVDKSYQPIELYKITQRDINAENIKSVFDVTNCPNYMFSQHRTTNTGSTFKLSRYSQFLPYDMSTSKTSFGLTHFVRIMTDSFKTEGDFSISINDVTYDNVDEVVSLFSGRGYITGIEGEDENEQIYAIYPKFVNDETVVTIYEGTVKFDKDITTTIIQGAGAGITININDDNYNGFSGIITEKTSGRTEKFGFGDNGNNSSVLLDLYYMFNILSKQTLDFNIKIYYKTSNGEYTIVDTDKTINIIKEGELGTYSRLLKVNPLTPTQEDGLINELRLFPVFHQIEKLTGDITDNELVVVVPNIPLTTYNKDIECMWTFINESTGEQIQYTTTSFIDGEEVGEGVATVQSPIVYPLGDFSDKGKPLPKGYYSIKLQYSMDGEVIDESSLHHAFHKI